MWFYLDGHTVGPYKFDESTWIRSGSEITWVKELNQKSSTYLSCSIQYFQENVLAIHFNTVTICFFWEKRKYSGTF